MKKHIITNNLGLKIMALVFSVFLWLIVVNVDNPVVSKVFNDIPVQIVNDDIITQSGEVYQVIGSQTVSVTVYANRQVSQELKADDIKVTADISQMDMALNMVPVTVSIPEYEGSYQSAEANPRNLTIQREKSGSKVLALTVKTKNEPRNGYILGDLTVHPENITITGPQSVLDQIDSAVALVDINGISKDEDRQAELHLYDINANEVSQNQLENNLGEDGLTVSVEVLPYKSVPVVFEASGTPANGYEYTGCTSEPETIRISGKSEELNAVSEIDVPASAISVAGATQSVVMTVDITPYLPEGISLVDENAANIKVTASVEQEGTRSIDFLVSSIKINNLLNNLQVSYPPDAEITFRFSGEQDRLDVLDISNAVSIDLKNYTKPGTYDVPVEVSIPDDITLLDQVTVKLTIEEKDTESSKEQNDEESQSDQNTQDSQTTQSDQNTQSEENDQKSEQNQENQNQ